MPTATATRPASPDTDAASLTPGITPTEADLITDAAHRFLDHMDPGGFHEITMATIAYHTATLFAPHTPAHIPPYNCQRPNQTHFCED